MSITNSKKRKWLHRGGLITGLIGAGASTLMLLFWFGGAMLQARLCREDWSFVALFPIHWVGVTIAGKWPLIGAVVLIADTLLLVGLLLNTRLDYMSFIGVLLLASGILFLLSWREGRKASGNEGEK